MPTIHNLGFPRIGQQRELKFALESYWQGNTLQAELEQIGTDLRAKHWQQQKQLDWLPAGDFSFYDQVLDTSFLVGNIPQRFKVSADFTNRNILDQYFTIARGQSARKSACNCGQTLREQEGVNDLSAGEMTKWFDTNYHYIVPEFTADSDFTLNPERLLAQIKQAKALNLSVKPVIIGPVTYLWLGKSKDNSDRLELLESLLNVYGELLVLLATQGIEWVQIDEPVLVTELSESWQHALRLAYYRLQTTPVKLLLTTYFGQLQENLQLACELPVNGLHINAVNNEQEVLRVLDWLPPSRILSLGIINGRNIWKSDLKSIIKWLEPVYERLQERLWLAPSSSLLHVPVDLDSETELDEEIKSWLSFAVQKLEELVIIKQALTKGIDSVSTELEENQRCIQSRQQSERVHNRKVKERVAAITEEMVNRQSAYKERAELHKQRFKLPLFPTTTIGSFPQTAEIRRIRKQYREGERSETEYREILEQEIQRSISEQEQLGLDVLVHGEAERNDMVEYFGEQLEGYAFSRFGWVQSYGSRCVKPPILYGDISREQAMTVAWIKYAQSLTDKPVKGMLTGPVTILNWSFVRDDQPRSQTAYQIALAIRDEVLDLEQAGIGIIQIDEAALREGLPLRRSQWQDYLDWAIRAFRIAANGVKDETQIHTHMCYSEFNDIIDAISRMDADVITIETSRSDMELLDVFDEFQYPNEIGPGVYDIHSPNIPDVEAMVDLLLKASERIPTERLWVNPDCGLKTRQWHEVRPALSNMIEASKYLRTNSSAA